MSATQNSKEKAARWITSTLVNDEASTDAEMRAYFMEQGPMSEQEAEFYVAQRNFALRDPLGFFLQQEVA